MEDFLGWGGVIAVMVGLLWLMGRFGAPATAVEKRRSLRNWRMHRESQVSIPDTGGWLVVIDELTDPHVSGFFASQRLAGLHAHRVVTGEEFIPGEWATVEDWHRLQDGVHVTRLATA